MLFLVDANNLFYKAYFASNKTYPQVKRNFFVTLFQVRKSLRLKESQLKIIWDARNTWRKQQYAAYKSGRNQFGDDKELKRFLMSRNLLKKETHNNSKFVQYEIDGFECDDIIAHMCLNLLDGEKAVILSGDKDFYQLLSEDVSIYRLGARPNLYTISDFRDEFGIEPNLWLDVKNLVGDSSDNIKGAFGIGMKRALTLVKKYGPLPKWDTKALEVEKSKESVMALGVLKDIVRLKKERRLMTLRSLRLLNKMGFDLDDNMYKR